MKRLLILFALMAGIAVPAIAADFRLFGRDSRAVIEREQRGHPFALVFWSVDCVYCIEEIKQLGELANSHSALRLILVNTDAPGMAAASTEALLRHLEKTPAERWMFDGGDSARLYFSVDKQWHGELPRTYIYDAKGNFKVIPGKMDTQWLKELARNNFTNLK
jgi:hypothetical protein